MKTLRFLAIAFGVCALASAQNINVQKASTTNNITGNLTFGTGKQLLGDTGSITNFSMVGIGTGTTTAATNLQVVDTATTTPRGITNDQYNNGTNGAQMNWRKARGTFATPLTAVTGDLLGRAIFWGYDGTSFIESGNLRFTSTGTIGTTRVPSVFDVYVSTDAAPSVLTQTASFSGTNGITLTALGTNKDVTLLQSGTGSVVAGYNTATNGVTVNAAAGQNHINYQAAGVTKWIQYVTTGNFDFGWYNGSATAMILTRNKNILAGGLTTEGTGSLQFPTGTAAAQGITFGTDLNFYRFSSSGDFGFNHQGGTTPTIAFLQSGSQKAQLQNTGANLRLDTTTAGGTITFHTDVNTVALTLDASQNSTFAGRAIGTSFGTASAAAVAVRYNSTSSITVNNATSTGLQFNNYGAGALSTDASGNITATSDGRLKNIVGAFARGLTSIRNLHPATYRWKKESGMDTEHDYTGFVAQDVQAAIPEAIGKTPDGFLTFSDRPVLAAAVNAINELDGKTVSKIEIRIFEFIALAALVLAIRANVRKN